MTIVFIAAKSSNPLCCLAKAYPLRLHHPDWEVHARIDFMLETLREISTTEMQQRLIFTSFVPRESCGYVECKWLIELDILEGRKQVSEKTVSENRHI
jgi:hypothetical protein